MSIWLISVIAVAAMLAGAAAYRLSGRRVNRRVRRRRSWSDLADDSASDTVDIDDEGLVDAFDEIDAYWGNAMPEAAASWQRDDERIVERDVALDEADVVRPALAAELPPALSALVARRAAAAAVASAPEEDDDHDAVGDDDEEEDDLSAVTPARAARRDADRVSLVEQTVGKKGCRLGAAYLTHLLENQFMPAGTRGDCTGDDVRAAFEALRDGQPTRILEHGAVLQRLGDDHVLLFDPLCRHVDHLQNLFHHVSCVVSKRSLHVVITGGDPSEPEAAAHIGPLVQQFSVPPTRLVVLQEDGTFHNHLEDQAHHVPAQLDAWAVPEAFMTRILEYAQARFDAGEPEAALRTMGPLAGALWERTTTYAAFDRMLMAQILNLLGLSNRRVGCLAEAVTCFESSLGLLREAEQYEAAQVVEVNLGITLAQHGQTHPEALRAATRHLQNAVRLDPSDAGTWMTLGEVFLRRHEVERGSSFLARAEHAFVQARRIDANSDVDGVLDEIARLRAQRCSIDQLPTVPNTSASVASLHKGRLESAEEEHAPVSLRAVGQRGEIR